MPKQAKNAEPCTALTILLLLACTAIAYLYLHQDLASPHLLASRFRYRVHVSISHTDQLVGGERWELDDEEDGAIQVTKLTPREVEAALKQSREMAKELLRAGWRREGAKVTQDTKR